MRDDQARFRVRLVEGEGTVAADRDPALLGEAAASDAHLHDERLRSVLGHANAKSLQSRIPRHIGLLARFEPVDIAFGQRFRHRPSPLVGLSSAELREGFQDQLRGRSEPRFRDGVGTPCYHRDVLFRGTRKDREDTRRNQKCLISMGRGNAGKLWERESNRQGPAREADGDGSYPPARPSAPNEMAAKLCRRGVRTPSQHGCLGGRDLNAAPTRPFLCRSGRAH